MNGGWTEAGSAVAVADGRSPTAQARAAVHMQARRLLDGAGLDEVVLLTGELVADAVLDDPGDLRPVALRLQRSGGTLRILVSLGERWGPARAREIWFDYPLYPEAVLTPP
jgi:hypothetical protein